MKKYLIILAVLLVLASVSSCRKKIVPEISPSLVEETLLEFKNDENPMEWLFVHDSQLVFITREGKISRLDPRKKMVTFLYSISGGIDPELYHQGGLVVLKKKNTNHRVIFDIKDMKVHRELENLDAAPVLYVDREVIGYRQANHLSFFNYLSGKEITRQAVPENAVFFNTADGSAGEPVLIFSTTHLYRYNPAGGVVSVTELKRKARTGFLRDRGHIYYGSDQRELVKLSWASNKVKWRFKMADTLKYPPIKAGPYIAAPGSDNNIYFFNKRGTLYWWERFNSILKLPPVTMEENVAVFLWDKSFKFFEWKKKRVVSYPLNAAALTNPVSFGQYLYMVTRVETEAPQPPEPILLTKLGNNFGVEVRTVPRYIIPMGKSIKFNLKKFNLIDANLSIRILDGAEKTVFTKTITYKQDSSFVWIPDRAEAFKLVIDVDSYNKKGLKIEEPFQVIDVERMLENYYYFLQKQSHSGRVAERR